MQSSQSQNINKENDSKSQLEQGTYEILRTRLHNHASDLRGRLEKLNQARKEVFGATETKLIATERITTDNNCIPVDMIPVGNNFIFGYNVHIGLKTEISLADVFSIYKYDNKTHSFSPQHLEIIENARFCEDFKNLYKYYRDTQFIKFAVIGTKLFMVFQVGKTVYDIKTFKWVIHNNSLEYIDNRSDHEFVFPNQHEFRWIKTTHEQHRRGKHPHISIEDKVFVETIGGDLTIKIEDNTDSGHGIYSEEVQEKEQTLEDAEIFYALIENIIILKIKPYKEPKFRYILYNQKTQTALRIDTLEDACVLLPDGHGLIFTNGYYLQTGEYKLFETQFDQMKFEKRISSPNGEDFLYVFFNQPTGSYLLYQYNLIEQRLDTPIKCHGYSLFDDGKLCFFRADDEPQKHHTISIWQTPFYSPNYVLPAESDSYLYKLGNKDLVRAMAECGEMLTLLNKEDSYLNLYIDLVKKSTDLADAWHWLNKPEAFALIEPITGIKQAAAAAIDEYDKVTKIKKNTNEQASVLKAKTEQLARNARNSTPDNIHFYVNFLADFRALRGEIISLRQLRYIDFSLVEKLETTAEEFTSKLSADCVQFLLQKEALQPYEQKVQNLAKTVEEIKKAADATAIEDEIAKLAKELEMLIEIVSSLKITDATETTKIIDNISAIYASFNSIKAALRSRRQTLAGIEGKAEFQAQIKLVEQSVANYIDVCDRPEKCEQYLNKLMIQLEELEGKFAEFDEFALQISEKREEIYNAFENRKIQLVEEQNRRANTLLQSAERILNAVQHKASTLKTEAEINGYFASDLMVDKIRNIIAQLQEIGDTVKADDIHSKLKTIREETQRQLQDKKDLFAEGKNLIKLGKYSFLTNSQPLDLTIVQRGEDMFLHLTGTNFFEKIIHPEFLATKEVWKQSIISENKEVYRAEYLAFQIWQNANNVNVITNKAASANAAVQPLNELQKMTFAELQQQVQFFMADRYNEGYSKGIHEYDAALILEAIIKTSSSAGYLRYASPARACAALYWNNFAETKQKETLHHRLKGAGLILQVFPDTKQFRGLVEEIQLEVKKFILETKLFDISLAEDAGEYLFYELSSGDQFIIDSEAANLYKAFIDHLQNSNFYKEFDKSLKALNGNPVASFKLLKQWLNALIDHTSAEDKRDYVEEAATLLLHNSFDASRVIHTSTKIEIEGLRGTHSTIQNGIYHFDYNAFLIKLKHFESHSVQLYSRYTQLKKEILENYREDIRLNEFKPKVLTSFVRNKLIDTVYLPLIGNNLAKQIGAAGDDKRTDRMGMLLVISPPGYGKTTLIEYVANRLGITFMKINGPAIGHKVTSLDPAEAPNANAKEELEKLNLALEMGDNIMIYVDDIQHCNPEFLQKFISLCDAQRKIEGIYKGKSKTYDLRGKKVCVVMAGNPYTESGEKFTIPDMLANRADSYNLGDVIGDTEDVFNLSYIENCLMANPVLRKLSAKSRKDVYSFIQLAETGISEGLEFEAAHSAEETNEYVSILKKLFTIRNIILKVNKEYIRSAAQSDEFRTEPAFKLQGSYRDMNKMAEKVMPLLNDAELQLIIDTHYTNEAQTLATGAEANLLKLKELKGRLSSEEAVRWEAIKTTYLKNKKLKGIGADNPIGHVVSHMEAITEGLSGIKEALEKK